MYSSTALYCRSSATVMSIGTSFGSRSAIGNASLPALAYARRSPLVCRTMLKRSGLAARSNFRAPRRVSPSNWLRRIALSDRNASMMRFRRNGDTSGSMRSISSASSGWKKVSASRNRPANHSKLFSAWVSCRDVEVSGQGVVVCGPLCWQAQKVHRDPTTLPDELAWDGRSRQDAKHVLAPF